MKLLAGFVRWLFEKIRAFPAFLSRLIRALLWPLIQRAEPASKPGSVPELNSFPDKESENAEKTVGRTAKWPGVFRELQQSFTLSQHWKLDQVGSILAAEWKKLVSGAGSGLPSVQLYQLLPTELRDVVDNDIKEQIALVPASAASRRIFKGRGVSAQDVLLPQTIAFRQQVYSTIRRMRKQTAEVRVELDFPDRVELGKWQQLSISFHFKRAATVPPEFVFWPIEAELSASQFEIRGSRRASAGALRDRATVVVTFVVRALRAGRREITVLLSRLGRILGTATFRPRVFVREMRHE